MGDFRLVKMVPIGAFRRGRPDKAARLNPVNNAIRRAVRPALLIGELPAKLTERLSFRDSLSYGVYSLQALKLKTPTNC